MRKTTAALSIASLGFAACAGYLAYELKNARDALAIQAATAAPPAYESVFAQPSSTNDPQTANTPQDLKDRWRASLAAQIPYLRAQLENPAKRAETSRDFQAGFRRDFPRLAGYLGLGEEEYRRLTDLLADQYLRYRDSTYQCALKPACDVMTIDARMKAVTDRELTDLLGTEKFERFTSFQHDIQRRRAGAEVHQAAR